MVRCPFLGSWSCWVVGWGVVFLLSGMVHEHFSWPDVDGTCLRCSGSCCLTSVVEQMVLSRWGRVRVAPSRVVVSGHCQTAGAGVCGKVLLYTLKETLSSVRVMSVFSMSMELFSSTSRVNLMTGCRLFRWFLKSSTSSSLRMVMVIDGGFSVKRERARFVAEILSPCVGNVEHDVTNSAECVRKLAHCTVLVCELVNTAYFTVQGNLSQQTEGAAMCSPVSRIVANLFMEDFQEKALAFCHSLLVTGPAKMMTENDPRTGTGGRLQEPPEQPTPCRQVHS